MIRSLVLAVSLLFIFVAPTFAESSTFSSPKIVRSNTLTVSYTCTQYDAPWNDSDVILVNISNGGRGYFSGIADITCDNVKHSVSVNLNAIFGGLSGKATLSLAHAGIDDAVAYAEQATLSSIRVIQVR
jgi:hypothetical protein